MSLIIDDPDAEYLAHALAALTGETVNQAVIAALRDRLTQVLKEESALDEIMAIAHHCASLPECDPRTPDEILGYDENGLPT